jgi:small-conductance mechanosensitive channel
MAGNPGPDPTAKLGSLAIDILKLLTTRQRPLLAIFLFCVLVLFAVCIPAKETRFALIVFMMAVAGLVAVIVVASSIRWFHTADLTRDERRIVERVKLLEEGMLGPPPEYISGPIRRTHESVVRFLEKLLE